MKYGCLAASVIVMLAVAVPASAQGRSGNHRPTSPAQSALPQSHATVAATTGAVPFAWIDDASMLDPGSVALAISVFHWQGTNVSELDVPVVSVSVGAARRFQIGASIPHVVDSSDTGGPVGGLGTTYISGKIGLLTGDTVKLAVAPTLQVLGEGALTSFAPGERRTQFGVPVSIEGDSGIVRVFASGGGFSPGIWFAGGGAGVQATSHVSVSGSFSRAWANASASTLTTSSRQELSGTMAYSPTSQVSLFASVGRTVNTTDENGAGTTVSGGVVFVIAPRSATP